MKRITISVLVFVITCTAVSARQTGPLPAPVTSIAEEATELVISTLPRQAGDPHRIVVAGFQSGMMETRLVTLFTQVISNRLVAAGGRWITVISQPSSTGAMPHYRLTVAVYPAEDDIYVTIQLIREADSAILGGFERSFAATDPLRALLVGSVMGGEGGDQHEPDGIDDPRLLPIGEMLYGHTIMPEEDEDWFLLDFEEIDGLASVEVHTTGQTDTYLSVFGPDDPYTLVTENDDHDDHNALVRFTVSPGQRFWVRVNGYDETITGAYGIVAMVEMYGDDPYEPNNSMSSATLLNADGDWLSTLLIPAGDMDWYAIDISRIGQGQVSLTIETAGDLDTWLDLYDSSGDLLAEDDDGSGTGNALVRFGIEEPGRYYARVRHYDESGSGPYSISAWIDYVESDDFEPDNSIEEATPFIIDGEPQRHTFNPADDVDWFRIQVPDGMTVIMETSGEHDSVMKLLDIEGNLIGEDDDGGENNNARIQRFLQQGTYYLEISQFSGALQAGSAYTLSVYSG